MTDVKNVKKAFKDTFDRYQKMNLSCLCTSDDYNAARVYWEAMYALADTYSIIFSIEEAVVDLFGGEASEDNVAAIRKCIDSLRKSYNSEIEDFMSYE